jgi:pimeloyl-ACP methyl ester carboxylesterase
MQKTACTKFVGAHLIDGAGHWVQQEQPARAVALVVEFLRQSRAPRA